MQTPYALWSTHSFPPCRREGFSLPELVLVMTIVGLVLGGALPAASRLRDRMAVVGARESVVGIFHKARIEAVAFGGASIVLRVSPPGAELWSAGALRSDVPLDGDSGVEMTLSSGRERVEIFYDALGLGRVASQTIRFMRNGSRSGLVVSSLGRVTRE
jgi:prepilin-type N-terminal cleavage/methylation domain-containing protein